MLWFFLRLLSEIREFVLWSILRRTKILHCQQENFVSCVTFSVLKPKGPQNFNLYSFHSSYNSLFLLAWISLSLNLLSASWTSVFDGQKLPLVQNQTEKFSSWTIMIWLIVNLLYALNLWWLYDAIVGRTIKLFHEVKLRVGLVSLTSPENLALRSEPPHLWGPRPTYRALNSPGTLASHPQHSLALEPFPTFRTSPSQRPLPPLLSLI